MMLDHVKQWEKLNEIPFNSPPSIGSIIKGFNLYLENEGKAKFSQETTNAITSSYSTLQQQKNWDEEHAKNKFALIRAALERAIIVHGISFTDEQMKEIDFVIDCMTQVTAWAKKYKESSPETKKFVTRVYESAVAKNVLGEQRTPDETIAKMLDTLTALRNPPTPPPVEPSSDSVNKDSENSADSADSADAVMKLGKSGATTNQSEIPKMPWLVDIDSNLLNTPSKLSYFVGLWYRLAFSRFSAWSDFLPSRLLSGAYSAIQSFAENLQSQNLDGLKAMLSPTLYKHYETLLNTYKEKKIELVLNLKSIDEGFITHYVTLQYMNPKNHDEIASLIPEAGPNLKDLQAFAIRRKLSTIGYGFWQEPDDGTIEAGYDPAQHYTRQEMAMAQIYVSFTAFVNCKEIYYLKDETGKIIEGSESTMENAHMFTFFTPMREVAWQIVDMNGFNATIADQLPLWQIEPHENYLLLRSYKKM